MAVTPPLPQVNQLVQLRLPGLDADLRSRVESVGDAEMVVAAPDADASGEDLVGEPLAGTPVRVVWGLQRGECVLATRMVAIEYEPVTMWRLAMAGPTEVVQRRTMARVHTDLRVLFNQQYNSHPAVLGQTIDLSEGAFRCRFPSAVDDVEPGELAAITFDLEGQRHQVPGAIRSVQIGTDSTEVVIVFDQPVAVARELRRFVLQTQIRHRRAGLT